MAGLMALAIVMFAQWGLAVAQENPEACGQEAEMLRLALGSQELEPSDDFLRCHDGSDQILSVIEHRDRVRMEREFARARQADTPQAWAAVLATYPTSALAQEALEAVKRLQFVEYAAAALTGDQLLFGRTVSVENCRSACSHRSACQGFTYSASQQACTLWSAVGVQRADADAYSGSRVPVAVSPTEAATAPAAPPTPPAPAVTFLEYQGSTFTGRALNSGPSADLAACRSSCGGDPDCRGFTFFKQRRVCTLWSVVSFRRGDARAISGRRTGEAQPPPQSQVQSARQTGYEYSYDVDFAGGDLQEPVRNVDQRRCERLCTSMAPCLAFTYVAAQKACMLKHSIVGQRGFSGAVSGRKR